MTNPAANRTSAPRRRRPSDGFTLIELLMAVTIILIAMAGLMVLFTTALAQTGDARQRQAGDSLLTQTMEQVRAVPYATVAKGLDTTNSLAAEPSLSTWTYNSEPVQHGNLGYTQTPFNVGNSPATGNVGHVQRITVSNTTYTVKTYVTQLQPATTPPAYRVSVVVSWTAYGKTKSVSGQTLVYSPSGCLSNATHPFGAPCQPFFYATADTGLGAVQVTPADPANFNGVSGIDLQQAQVLLPEEHATMDVEQITKVIAKGVTSGGTLDLNSGSPNTVGSVGAAPQADTDPASAASPFASNALAQVAGTLVQTEGGGPNANWIQVQSSNADTGTATATASATAASSPTCKTLAGASVTTSLPCASVDLQQAGSTPALGTSTIKVDVHSNSPQTDWGVIPLASIGPAPGKTSTFVSRSTVAGGLTCTTTSGSGCVHAGAVRRVGTIRVAGLPPGVTAPPGWDTVNNFLVELSGYTDQVDAESGINAAVPLATRSGTLKYWNGTGYITVPIGAATPAPITLSPFSVIQGSGSGTFQVTTSGTITFGALQTNTVLPAGCTTLCTATATSQSPVVVSIDYTITKDAATLAKLKINVGLDNLEASTKYRAAPVAG